MTSFCRSIHVASDQFCRAAWAKELDAYYLYFWGSLCMQLGVIDKHRNWFHMPDFAFSTLLLDKEKLSRDCIPQTLRILQSYQRNSPTAVWHKATVTQTLTDRGKCCYMQVDISFPTGHCQRQDDGWGRAFGQMGFSSIRWEKVWLDQCKQIAGSNYKSCSDKTHSFQELSKN